MRHNVYIKQEHELLWQRIPNKSEWIGQQLEATSNLKPQSLYPALEPRQEPPSEPVYEPFSE